MENIILNALNNALNNNILVIDDNDSSINYRRSEISNMHENMIENYFDTFFNDMTEENLVRLINYSKNTGYKHIPSSWREVQFIMEKMKEFDISDNNWIDIDYLMKK